MASVPPRPVYSRPSFTAALDFLCCSSPGSWRSLFIRSPVDFPHYAHVPNNKPHVLAFHLQSRMTMYGLLCMACWMESKPLEGPSRPHSWLCSRSSGAFLPMSHKIVVLLASSTSCAQPSLTQGICRGICHVV